MASPVRRCLSCRRRAPKSRLVRLVWTGGTAAVDPPARAPGRGAYLCGAPECLERAVSRGGAPILRALRQRTGQIDEAAIRREVRTAATAAALEQVSTTAAMRSD